MPDSPEKKQGVRDQVGRRASAHVQIAGSGPKIKIYKGMKKSKRPSRWRTAKKAVHDHFWPPIEFPEGTLASDVVESLHLRQQDLRRLKKLFEEIDCTGIGEIHKSEFYEMMDEPRSVYADAVFELVDMDGSGTLDFEELIGLLATYCMYTRHDILTFVFDTFDLDHSGEMNDKEFVQLVSAVNDANPMFGGNFANALSEFDTDGDGMINMLEFQALNQRFPMILFPAFRMQDRMQKLTLGEQRWTEIWRLMHKKKTTIEFMNDHDGRFPPLSLCEALVKSLWTGVNPYEALFGQAEGEVDWEKEHAKALLEEQAEREVMDPVGARIVRRQSMQLGAGFTVTEAGSVQSVPAEQPRALQTVQVQQVSEKPKGSNLLPAQAGLSIYTGDDPDGGARARGGAKSPAGEGRLTPVMVTVTPASAVTSTSRRASNGGGGGCGCGGAANASSPSNRRGSSQQQQSGGLDFAKSPAASSSAVSPAHLQPAVVARRISQGSVVTPSAAAARRRSVEMPELPGAAARRRSLAATPGDAEALALVMAARAADSLGMGGEGGLGAAGGDAEQSLSLSGSAGRKGRRVSALGGARKASSSSSSSSAVAPVEAAASPGGATGAAGGGRRSSTSSGTPKGKGVSLKGGAGRKASVGVDQKAFSQKGKEGKEGRFGNTGAGPKPIERPQMEYGAVKRRETKQAESAKQAGTPKGGAAQKGGRRASSNAPAAAAAGAAASSVKAAAASATKAADALKTSAGKRTSTSSGRKGSVTGSVASSSKQDITQV
jgi:Ca2+-binding EF-hand superfamily protein